MAIDPNKNKPEMPKQKAPVTKAEKKAASKAKRIIPSWMPERKSTKENRQRALDLNDQINKKRTDPTRKNMPLFNPYPDNNPKNIAARKEAAYKIDYNELGPKRAAAADKIRNSKAPKMKDSPPSNQKKK